MIRIEGLPLDNFPVVITWPVQWGDQDSFSHVNNTVYFRWFESGRIAYFERLGFGHAVSDAGLGPILASINCIFAGQSAILIRSRLARA